jgi:uncharacterized protein YkwD
MDFPRIARPVTSRRSHLAPLLSLALLAAVLVAPAPAAAVDTLTVSAAESAMVAALNADRTSHGLVPVRVDTRLMAIARARSADMVANNYFSHTQTDGRSVFDILSTSGITWFGAGEIIAVNNYPTFDTSLQRANLDWLNSPGHYAIVVSTSYNYVGVGLAVDTATGKKFWTAVYMKGPDRTGARATIRTPSISAGSTSARRRVRVSWSGADVQLQVLTSGLYTFRVQRRTDGGSWVTVKSSTTRTALAFDLARHHKYQFRVRARDRAGNWGTWSTVGVSLG